jgi:hypothetical protein
MARQHDLSQQLTGIEHDSAGGMARWKEVAQLVLHIIGAMAAAIIAWRLGVRPSHG